MKKKKPGRPKSCKEIRSKRVVAMVTPVNDRRVRYLAAYYGLSVSEYVGRCVERELTREGDK